MIANFLVGLGFGVGIGVGLVFTLFILAILMIGAKHENKNQVN